MAAAVAVCARHRVPVVPRGAGSGLQRAIKAALDPHDILNPGKAL